jgi:hypothetical protein
LEFIVHCSVSSYRRRGVDDGVVEMGANWGHWFTFREVRDEW